MEKDFFSELSENLNGLDIAFGLVGLLWLFGTVQSILNISTSNLLILALLWAGFCIGYYWVRKRKIRSNWKSITLTVVALLVWKGIVQTSVSIIGI